MTFWFIETDKLLIPTYRYYVGVGVFLLLGLAPAFEISRRQRWIVTRDTSVLRYALGAAIVTTSAVLAFAIVRVAGRASSDPINSYLSGILLFLLLISAACWIVSGRLYYLGLLFNLLSIPMALALLIFLAKTVMVPSELAEVITYAIYHSLLAAACGFWLARSMA